MGWVFSCFPFKISNLPQIQSISSHFCMLSFIMCASVMWKQSLEVLSTIQAGLQRAVPVQDRKNKITKTCQKLQKQEVLAFFDRIWSTGGKDLNCKKCVTEDWSLVCYLPINIQDLFSLLPDFLLLSDLQGSLMRMISRWLVFLHNNDS